MRRISGRILLVLVLLSLLAFTCVINKDIDFFGLLNFSINNQEEISNRNSSQTLNATATFGAEQFHIQLTAIADQNK